MRNRIFSVLLAAGMLLSLAACKGKEPVPPTQTNPTTEPTSADIEHFNLTEIDLAGIGELFAQEDTNTLCKIQLDGLCAPVVMELEGTDIVSISAYGTTVWADRDCEYTSIYGNLQPVIYDHQGMIFLNVWYYDTGYSCVIFPDGSFKETYPDDEYSVMIYLDEEERMCQSKFALKFLGLEQWDTAPIDMAVSRDDFYYSIEDASWTQEDGYTTTPRESYTISDWFELDEIFNTAKKNGLYPEFEMVDELLEYNAQRFQEAENDNTGNGPDTTEEKQGYFGHDYVSNLYDDQKKLLQETYYDYCDYAYFTKTHTYDDLNRDISGSWSFCGEEAYRYANTYDSKNRLTETLWYQADKEVERFTYTYDSKGGHTETFFQNGEKKYTYTFNGSGELTACSTYEKGREVKTHDVKGLVKTQLLTDIWYPFMDNGSLHAPYYYDGTVPREVSVLSEVISGEDGSYIMIQRDVDEEDGTPYEHEYHYDAQDHLLKEVHKAEGVEFNRDEYTYDSNGRRISQVFYVDGKKQLTREFYYDEAGYLIREERTSTEPEIEYINGQDETGMDVSTSITYTKKTQINRYNDQGLLAETVSYANGEPFRTDTYEYDDNGYILPSRDTFQYVYNVEGVLEGIWLIYDDWASGVAQLRSRTVYVTPENAQQLRKIMRNELTWF